MNLGGGVGGRREGWAIPSGTTTKCGTWRLILEVLRGGDYSAREQTWVPTCIPVPKALSPAPLFKTIQNYTYAGPGR